jgi:hypothetical protein
MSLEMTGRMSAALRWTSYLIFALLWLSGCAWLVLHYLLPQQGQFGPLPNPWEPGILRVHGLLAVAGVFLLGWISGGHIVDRWPLYRARVSGPFLAVLAVFLVASGYALYYTTDRLHDLAATTHEILGGAGIFLALLHWRRNGCRRRK